MPEKVSGQSVPGFPRHLSFPTATIDLESTYIDESTSAATAEKGAGKAPTRMSKGPPRPPEPPKRTDMRWFDVQGLSRSLTLTSLTRTTTLAPTRTLSPFGLVCKGPSPSLYFQLQWRDKTQQRHSNLSPNRNAGLNPNPNRLRGRPNVLTTPRHAGERVVRADSALGKFRL